MGLNVGVVVKKFKHTGEHCGQSHPANEGLRDRFWEHLTQTFPGKEHAFGVDVEITEEAYDFGVRFVHYGRDFGYETTDMYRAIIDFVLGNFGFLEENLEMSLYWLG